MEQVKNSAGPSDLPSLAHKLVPLTITTMAGPAETSRFDFAGNAPLTAKQVLRQAHERTEGTTGRDDRKQTAA
jgi:hypothetical protein